MDSDDKPGGGQPHGARYTDAEVQAIIRAALERQRDADTIGREELDEVAAAAGVSPEHLQAVIDEYDARLQSRRRTAESGGERASCVDMSPLLDCLRDAQAEARSLWRDIHRNQRRIWREFTREF